MNRREKATREDGEQWRYDYNARGEVTSGVKAKGTATNAALRTGMQFGYEYDLIGNRIEESVHTPAGLAVQDWVANEGNQVTQREIAASRWLLGRVHPEADLTVTGGGTAQREDWEFAVPVESSPAGAATWKQVTVTATREGAGENGADVEGTLEGNHWFAANPENMTYDEDGNLSSDGRWSYHWDGENRLKVMQTQPGAKAAGVPARRLEFAYDAQGRRIRKLVQSFELAEGPYTTIKDHRYIYEGWNMVAEFEVQGTPELTGAYAWGSDISGTMTGAGGVGGLVLAQKPKTGWTYAPCYDGNGNVSTYVSAASGAVRAKFDYDPYGRPIWNELAGAEELPAYRFSTKYEDVETGLLYYGYRYYSSELGRWINRDPIEEQGGTNLYGMVGNDALNKWDVLGLKEEKTIILAAGLGKHETNIFGSNNPRLLLMRQKMKEYLGYDPKGYSVGSSPITNTVYLQIQIKAAHQALAEKKQKCSVKIKVDMAFTKTAPEMKKHLSKEGDLHIVFAHGSPLPTGQTGLLMTIPGLLSPINNEEVAGLLDLSQIIPDNPKFYKNRLGVGCCYPGYLPKKAAGVEIAVVNDLPEAKTETMQINFWNKFRYAYSCLCEPVNQD